MGDQLAAFNKCCCSMRDIKDFTSLVSQHQQGINYRLLGSYNLFKHTFN